MNHPTNHSERFFVEVKNPAKKLCLALREFMMTISTSSSTKDVRNGSVFKLNQEQIQMIEEALQSIGEFGEVRLVVEKGRLRFLVTQKSVDALKWEQDRDSSH